MPPAFIKSDLNSRNQNKFGNYEEALKELQRYLDLETE
jgi:hypothetical protein